MLIGVTDDLRPCNRIDGLSPGNYDLHVIVYICMLDRKTSYLTYMHERVRIEIYYFQISVIVYTCIENYFETKKEINKRKQNEFSAAAQKVPKFLPRQRIISRGPLLEPGLKGAPPVRSAAATFGPGW